MVSRSQYGEREVNACKAVLLELVHLTGEIKDEMVIIGGWTPTFILPRSDDPHVGKVDLMAGEYGGTGKGHRTQKIQDVRARKARGCDLAFDAAVTVTIEGHLPDGGKDTASFKVAGIVPFLVMKGMAMYERMKEKDAYDIYYCVEHFPGGVEGLAAEFRSFIKNKLVIEGLGKIKNKFASVEHIGSKWVADFLEVTEREDRDIIMRRAYEKINELLDLLHISAWKEV